MKEDDKEKRIFAAVMKLFVENGIEIPQLLQFLKKQVLQQGIFTYNKVDLINKLYMSIKKKF